MINFSFAQQGWQCPVCKAVFSPFTPICYNCRGTKTSYSTNSKESE